MAEFATRGTEQSASTHSLQDRHTGFPMSSLDDGHLYSRSPQRTERSKGLGIGGYSPNRHLGTDDIDASGRYRAPLSSPPRARAPLSSVAGTSPTYPPSHSFKAPSHNYADAPTDNSYTTCSPLHILGKGPGGSGSGYTSDHTTDIDAILNSIPAIPSTSGFAYPGIASSLASPDLGDITMSSPCSPLGPAVAPPSSAPGVSSPPPHASRHKASEVGAGHAASGGGGDAHEFEELAASVERLRRQRLQVERIKAESAQKDALIRQLQHEIQQVKATRTQHQQLREQVSSLAEELRGCRALASEKGRALTQAHDAWSVKETLYKETIARLKQDCDALLRKYTLQVEEQASTVHKLQRQAQAQAQHHSQEHEKLQAACVRQEEALRALQRENQALRESIDQQSKRAQAHRAAGEAKAQQLQHTLQSREAELGDVRVRCRLLEEEASTHRDRTAQAESEAEVLCIKLSDAEAKAQHEAHQRAQLRHELGVLREELGGLKTSRTVVKTLQSKVCTLESELESRGREKAELARRLASREEKLQALRQSAESKAALKQELESLRHQLEEEREDRRRAAHARAALLAEFSEAEGQLQATLDQAGLPLPPSPPRRPVSPSLLRPSKSKTHPSTSTRLKHKASSASTTRVSRSKSPSATTTRRHSQTSHSHTHQRRHSSPSPVATRRKR